MATCPISGCGRGLSRAMVMCKRHWRMLDLNFRAWLWNRFRARRRDEHANEQYLTAHAEAVRQIEASIKAKHETSTNEGVFT